MNRLMIGLIVALALVVPSSALAESYTVSDMFMVRTVHVGDTITVFNNDNKTHSISGKTSTGETIDDKISAGQSVDIQFLFPGQFSFYDKYDKSKFGTIYVYEPSVNLTAMTVYNKTSITDLFQAPIYAQDLVIPNSTNNSTPLANQTNIGSSSTPSSGGSVVSFGISNSTQPIVTQNTTTTPTDISKLEAKIDSLTTEVQSLKAQEQAHYDQSTTMTNTIFGMLVKLLHVFNLQ